MTLEQLKTYLETYLPELYRFAFALIPDDLQAQQLVFDSISVLSLDRKDLVLGTMEISDDKKSSQLFEVKKGLLKIIKSLAYKRSEQLGALPNKDNVGPSFYELALECRGILCLKHELSLDFEDIESVMELPRHEVVSKLYMGRGALSRETQNIGIYG